MKRSLRLELNTFSEESLAKPMIRRKYGNFKTTLGVALEKSQLIFPLESLRILSNASKVALILIKLI